jgi:hypothetical protein
LPGQRDNEALQLGSARGPGSVPVVLPRRSPEREPVGREALLSPPPVQPAFPNPVDGPLR